MFQLCACAAASMACLFSMTAIIASSICCLASRGACVAVKSLLHNRDNQTAHILSCASSRPHCWGNLCLVHDNCIACQAYLLCVYPPCSITAGSQNKKTIGHAETTHIHGSRCIPIHTHTPRHCCTHLRAAGNCSHGGILKQPSQHLERLCP